MAGHSKWANIKHKKKANDIKKSKLFSKLANNIKTSIIDSNIDIKSNSKLKKAIDDALANNMSKDIINNILYNENTIIQEKVTYAANSNEGFIFIIECFNSNKNRIIGELRCILNQYNINLIPLKDIEYLFNRYCKINFLNIYNNKYVIDYFNNKIQLDLIDNNLFLKIEESKIFFSELKLLNMSFTSNIFFYPKNLMLIDDISLKRMKDLISKLKKISYISNIFFNFKNT